MRESERLQCLKGVGEKKEEQFRKRGICTVGDLIRYYPKEFEIYEDPIPIANVEENKVCTVSGSVFGRIQVSGNQKLQITTLYLKDLTGMLKVVWFRMPFLRNTLGKCGTIVLRGRVVHRKDGLVMQHPEVFYPASRYEEKLHSMQPVYALTSGLTNNTFIRAVQQALQHVDPRNDILPAYLSEKYGFMNYEDAVRNMHFPTRRENFAVARERFVFEEFLVFILSLRRIKESENRKKNRYVLPDHPQIYKFLDALPFRLTGAQMKTWEEIRRDMQGEYVMSRLVQGDVGSGKTVVAFLALLSVGLTGYQGALMAPTEVLARQHFNTITEMLKKYELPLEAELLTGSMTAGQKRKAYERIQKGEAALIIGTHALVQEKIMYHDLALVVTDEQHRFGVRQREMLAQKGNAPHILVMSATPIPRTLAIILYGDLDISVIDEMPKSRLPIKNCVVDTGYRDKAYSFMKDQVMKGRQCYVICPMVEESESLDAENVMEYSRTLQDTLQKEICVGCLHGKMKQEEKEKVMDAFLRNEIQVLVSTTVVEVGIDVPNATVMMIENAERFGLAQLHQLRGRVGRGTHQSYCIFMSASKSDETKERLQILNHSNDGFFIASEDLRLRGPGDLFGIRQSGMLDFHLADVFQDAAMLRRASEEADNILRSDPDLKMPFHLKLKNDIDRKMRSILLETTL